MNQMRLDSVIYFLMYYKKIKMRNVKGGSSTTSILYYFLFYGVLNSFCLVERAIYFLFSIDIFFNLGLFINSQVLKIIPINIYCIDSSNNIKKT